MLLSPNTSVNYWHINKHPDLLGNLREKLSVPRIKTKQVEAAFSFYAPHLLNKISEYLRFVRTVSSFISIIFFCSFPLKEIQRLILIHSYFGSLLTFDFILLHSISSNH